MTLLLTEDFELWQAFRFRSRVEGARQEESNELCKPFPSGLTLETSNGNALSIREDATADCGPPLHPCNPAVACQTASTQATSLSAAIYDVAIAYR